MSRPRTRPSQVELLPVTRQLLALLDAQDSETRQDICAEAEVPYASLSQWRTGQYHPGLGSISRLLRAFGKRLTVTDGVDP